MGEKIYLTEVVLLTKSYNLQDFKDWLDWHINKLGFNHAQIFDNESLVDIKSICEEYGDKVSYEKIIGFPDQYNLYNKYINEKCKAWWVLPIDDDEFLWMKNFNNVDKMILYYQDKWPDMNKLSIRWQNMFPKDPQAERGNMSLMEFNTEANEEWAKLFNGENKAVKTIVKTTNKIVYSMENLNQTHNPISLEKRAYLCNGERLKGNLFFGPYTDNDLKILHYQFKSKNEWYNKCLFRKSSVKKDENLRKELFNKENIWKMMK